MPRAIRKQYPVIAQNLSDVIGGKEPGMLYDGYSSCPLITENGKVILAEFGYDGKLLPQMYWRGMVKGLM